MGLDYLIYAVLCYNLVIKCLNKQATVDDDPTGIRWINSDLIGLKHKMKNIKRQRPIQRRKTELRPLQSRQSRT